MPSARHISRSFTRDVHKVHSYRSRKGTSSPRRPAWLPFKKEEDIIMCFGMSDSLLECVRVFWFSLRKGVSVHRKTA